MVDLSFSEATLTRRIDGITAFIEDQCAAAGVDDVVIGISGGVDSATTTALAARALGPDHVSGLILPADPTGDESIEYANRVAETFDVETRTVDMEPITQAVLEAHPETVSKHSAGNVRARVRALYWYLIANEEDRLVLGGGNRTEWLTGYFTKYGDIAVDCLPLGNLYKQQVRQVARHLGVPDAIVTRSPTAELWVDQTDEGELGIDYEALDGILALHVDGRIPRDETAALLDIDEHLIDHVLELLETSRHKRRLPPTPPQE